MMLFMFRRSNMDTKKLYQSAIKNETMIAAIDEGFMECLDIELADSSESANDDLRELIDYVNKIHV